MTLQDERLKLKSECNGCYCNNNFCFCKNSINIGEIKKIMDLIFSNYHIWKMGAGHTYH